MLSSCTTTSFHFYPIVPPARKAKGISPERISASDAPHGTPFVSYFDTEMTMLYTLNYLNHLQTTYQKLLKDGPENFRLFTTFIPIKINQMAHKILRNSTNTFSQQEITDFAAWHKQLLQQINVVVASRTELEPMREFIDAMTDSDEKLSYLNQKGSPADPTTTTSPEFAPYSGTIQKNIQSAINLLRHETMGFGERNPILAEIHKLAGAAGQRELQIDQLTQLAEKLSQLADSELENPKPEEQVSPEDDMPNPRFTIIRVIRQVIFSEINKKRIFSLSSLRRGVSRIDTFLKSASQREAEKELVRNLEIKWDLLIEHLNQTTNPGDKTHVAQCGIYENLTELAALLCNPDQAGIAASAEIQMEVVKLRDEFAAFSGHPEKISSSSAPILTTAALLKGQTDLFAMLMALKPKLEKARDTPLLAAQSRLFNKALNAFMLQPDSYLTHAKCEQVIAYLDLWTEELGSILAYPDVHHPVDEDRAKLIQSTKEDIAEIKKFCEAASSKCPDPLDPRSRVGFLKIFRKIHGALKDFDQSKDTSNNVEVRSTIDLLYRYILAGNMHAISPEQWNFISLSLKKVLTLLPKDDELTFSGYKPGFIKENLKYLAFVSDAGWAAGARKKIIDYFCSHIYKDQYDPSYATTKVNTGTLSFNLPFVKVSLSGGITSAEMTDDEGYPGAKETTTVGAGVEANIGSFVGGAKVFSVGLDGSYESGRYREWDNVRDKIAENFQELVKLNLHDEIVKQYSRQNQYPAEQSERTSLFAFARSAITNATNTVATKAAEKDTPPLRIETLAITLENVDKIRTLYDMQREHMSKLFSTTVGGQIMRSAERPVARETTTQTTNIIPTELPMPEKAGINIPVETLSGNVTAKVGVELTSVIELSLSGAIGGTRSAVKVPRHSGLCVTLGRLHANETYNDIGKEKRIEAAAKIKAKIASRSAKFKMTLESVQRKSVTLKLESTMRQLEAHWREVEKIGPEAALDLAQQAKLSTFMRIELEGLKDIWADLPIAKPTVNATDSELSELQEQTDIQLRRLSNALKYLEEDFDCYTKFQAQVSYGDHTSYESIAAMHERLGIEDKPGSKKVRQRKETRIKTAGEYMYRMQILTAWTYARAQELEEAAPHMSDQIQKMKTDLVALEKSMRECRFEIDQKDIKERASYVESAILETREVAIKVSAKAALLGVVGPQLALKGTWRGRDHTNPLRSGDYIDLELRLTPAMLNTMPNSMLIEYVREHTLKFGEDCCNQVCDSVAKFMASGITASVDLVLNFKLFKPKLFPGLGYRFWNLRVNCVTGRNITVSTPGFLMTASYNNEKTKVESLADFYSNDSILYFGLRYFHDWVTKDISKEGEIGPQSYWATVKFQQKKTLRDLLLKLGKVELDKAQETDESRKLALTCGVLDELTALESVFKGIPKNPKVGHQAAIDHARKALSTATSNFATTNSDNDYEAALAALEKIMSAYAPLLNIMRKKSDLFKPEEFSLQEIEWQL